MAKKILENIKMGCIRCSGYLSSVEGVLRALGMWDQESYLLAGMTGIAFHFIVHEKACPSSVTVYDWQQVHFEALDRIGISSEVVNLFYKPELNTFDVYQKHAVKRIKKAIDDGMGVVVWAPTPLLEFGIIKGYDDEDGVFFAEDFICSENPDPLLYENLGKAEAPLLSYQIFLRDGVKVSPEKIYRDSLLYGIREWEKEVHTDPRYSSGRKGYENLIKTLERGDFIHFGLAYIIFSYSDAKLSIAKYLDYLAANSEEFKDLKTGAELYHEIAQKFNRLEELIPFRGPASSVETNNLPEIINLVKDAKEIEEKAMVIIKKVLND